MMFCGGFYMKIIDGHIHIKGGDIFKTENTAEEIISVLDRSGIRRTSSFFYL